MNYDQFKRLRDLLIQHEGLRLKPYKDTVGKLTIGVGRNLDDVGVTEAEAMTLLKNDLDRVLIQATENFPWFTSLTFVRQDVVLSMMFNLGLNGFKGFKKMIIDLQLQNYSAAASEMLNSKWADQVGDRAKHLARMMISNQY